MIYLDYASTCPVDKEVLNTYLKASEEFFASTSAMHFLGKEANKAYMAASEEIKAILNLKHHNIIYTLNATEANNLAILGQVSKYSGGRIITTKVEHASVYEVMKSLEDRYDVYYLDVDEFGQIDLNQLRSALNNETILVSIMWVNNVVGSVMDVAEIIDIVKHYHKAKLHIDIVQGFCKVVNDFDFNDIDMFTISTHKIYGPKGIGVLFVKDNLNLKKIIQGSTAQFNLRPGTFDLSLVIATAKTIKKFYPLTKDFLDYVTKLSQYLLNGLKDNKKIIINSPSSRYNPYILSLSVPSIKGETLVRILEDNKIYVSTGSACSSKSQKPEKTIFAMTKDVKRATSAIRISLSHLTTFDELNEVIRVLKEI